MRSTCTVIVAAAIALGTPTAGETCTITAYTVNWYALGPVNEQLRSAGDPWLAWVRQHAAPRMDGEREVLTFAASADAALTVRDGKSPGMIVQD